MGVKIYGVASLNVFWFIEVMDWIPTCVGKTVWLVVVIDVKPLSSLP
ncbi:MAG: hypothetical protein ACI8SR_003348 [Oceanicoccus sp.]|jgi:hypothetical protein